MTRPKTLPSLEELQERFNYDPETGVLSWKVPTHPRIKPGDLAGCGNGKGYLKVKVGNSPYRVHRIIWKLAYGEDPPANMEIDHVNRNRADNRLTNLRLVTPSENNFNRESYNRRGKPIILTRPNGEEVYYSSAKEAAITEGLHRGDLSKVISGKRKHTKGYTARFANDRQP